MMNMALSMKTHDPTRDGKYRCCGKARDMVTVVTMFWRYRKDRHYLHNRYGERENMSVFGHERAADRVRNDSRLLYV